MNVHDGQVQSAMHQSGDTCKLGPFWYLYVFLFVFFSSQTAICTVSTNVLPMLLTELYINHPPKSNHDRRKLHALVTCSVNLHFHCFRCLLAVQPSLKCQASRFAPILSRMLSSLQNARADSSLTIFFDFVPSLGDASYQFCF